MRKGLVVVATIVVIAAIVSVLVALFFVARNGIEEEWAGKFPSDRRSAEDVRSLLDSLVERPFDEAAPAFIPQSMWDNERCSAAVIQAANFILGEKLQVVAAWKFGPANVDHVRLVLDRSSGFNVVFGRIIDQNKTKVDDELTASLDLERLYIAGYHFRRSRMDEHIIQSGGDLNSHLVLVFNYQGQWWGYHFFHRDGKSSHSEPFLVEKLADIERDGFDLVYVWELKDFQMSGEDRGSLVFTHYRPSYGDATEDLGLFGPNSVGYWYDTVVSYYRSRSHKWEQFPRANDKNAVVTRIPPGVLVGRGEVLGSYRGVEVRKHFSPSERGQFGLEYQCVELVNRFLAQALGHRNLTRTGNADSYFFNAKEKGLIAFPNGSSVKPTINDILVFDRDNQVSEKQPGHVAIVAEVTDGRVCVVQQNTSVWYQCLSLKKVMDYWLVNGFVDGLPCVGWARLR